MQPSYCRASSPSGNTTLAPAQPTVPCSAACAYLHALQDSGGGGARLAEAPGPAAACSCASPAGTGQHLAQSNSQALLQEHDVLPALLEEVSMTRDKSTLWRGSQEEVDAVEVRKLPLEQIHVCARDIWLMGVLRSGHNT